MTQNFKNWITGLCLATALAAPAQAAVYVGNWDPAFGPPLSDVGWRGSATFTIDDSCLALADGSYIAPACMGAAATPVVTDMVVELYDVGDVTQATKATMNFGDLLVSDVLKIGVLGGELVGLETVLSAPFQVNLNDVRNSGNPNDYWYFYLGFKFSTLGEPISAILAADPVDNPPPQFYSSETPTFTLERVGAPPASVPEPGSLLLAAAALAALAWARRPAGASGLRRLG